MTGTTRFSLKATEFVCRKQAQIRKITKVVCSEQLIQKNNQ